MWIVSQDREDVINTERIDLLSRDDGNIRVNIFDEWWRLASYGNEQRAKQVFEELKIFLQKGYVRDFFYMPEE